MLTSYINFKVFFINFITFCDCIVSTLSTSRYLRFIEMHIVIIRYTCRVSISYPIIKLGLFLPTSYIFNQENHPHGTHQCQRPKMNQQKRTLLKLTWKFRCILFYLHKTDLIWILNASSAYQVCCMCAGTVPVS